MLDIFGLFLFLAGFVIGLGSVTVIDIHGFLGRKSLYWTEATVRTHKVTKPLIWIGIFLVIIGGLIFYRAEALEGIVLVHGIIALVLILNGLFLSFFCESFFIKKRRRGEIIRITLSIIATKNHSKFDYFRYRVVGRLVFIGCIHNFIK